jgi:hypothetical protein
MAMKTESPLKKPSRRIPEKVALILYVQAGGRCEFDGCNAYLLEHYPTETVGNFADRAHIWAFKKRGPRGSAPGRPVNINALQNLILLCKDCHDLVDKKKPADYPVDALQKFKREHEDRIFSLTSIAKDRDTVPLVLRGLVRGRPTDVSDEEMQEAVAPDSLKRRDKIDCDLTGLPDTPDDGYWPQACKIIDAKIDALGRLEPRPGRALRVSVFAIARIPLLIYVGSKLSDKMEVGLFQRHRLPESWRWKDGVGEMRYITRRLDASPSPRSVTLFVNLSGRNSMQDLPEELRDGAAYELTLDGIEPSLFFLNTRGDLERFTFEYHRATSWIRSAHPELKLHLFPAVPAPAAITLGRSRLPFVDPKLVVYDKEARVGGFVRTLEIP